MPRPRNVERKEKIEQQARILLREKGYKKTSYTDIAEACGLEKTNIQIHFPRKELFLYHFMEDILNASDDYFAASNLKTDNFLVNFYLVGQVFYAFLLSEPGLQTFTRDILSDRKLTEGLIQTELNWADNYIRSYSNESYTDDIAFVMGGVYELLYRHLSSGNVPDPKDIQYRTMSVFMMLEGMDEDQSLLDNAPLIDYAKSNAFLMKKLY